MRLIFWLALGGVMLVVLRGSTVALAQDVASAAAAFERGQQAQLAGDHAEAARFYEIADAAAPSAEALRSAMRQRYAAGDDALAASHALALRARYGDDQSTRRLANRALRTLAPRLLHLRVLCPEVACTVVVDGEAVGSKAESRHSFFVDPGEHKVVATIRGARTPAHSVAGVAGDSHELTFSPPPGSERPKIASNEVAPRRRKARPAFFISGLGVLAAVGCASIWSGVDTLRKHQRYLTLQQDGAPAVTLQAAYEKGLQLQLRTNLLFGATAAVAVATLVLGFFTEWRKDEPRSARSARGLLRAGLSVTPSGGLLLLEGAL